MQRNAGAGPSKIFLLEPLSAQVVVVQVYGIAGMYFRAGGEMEARPQQAHRHPNP
jgi:hypothetical protein